ncbi:MAG: glycogen debranching enzyme N-terminal domain-containing protein [Cyanobacteria bacterium]|nr:glycogen debranching enzyme N-terminal domain-containing protein [Cyanobacteriota bacterium]
MSTSSEQSLIRFGREVCRHPRLADGLEWLVTNGLGSYASGSIGGALTRSYHGLLVAAITPPGDRRLLLSHLDETVEQGTEVRLELSGNLWQGGGRSPDAARWIERFELVAGLPRWIFSRGDLQLERLIWMEQGANITWVRYGLLRSEAPVTLHIRALVNQRSFHGGDLPGDLRVVAIDGGVRVERHDSDPASLELIGLPESAEAEASLELKATTIPYLGYDLPRERERGLGDSDRHLQAMELRVRLAPGEHFSLRAHCPGRDAATASQDGAAAWQRRLERQRDLLERWSTGPGASFVPAPPWVKQLVLAADQFLVSRVDAGSGGPATTVMAGYHWFQDWGRDTLLSLPGLTISTGRLDIARSLLLSFAESFDRGMLPNRFPEIGRPLEEGDFNTVDAALWYFQALRQYMEATDDQPLAEQLYDRLEEVLEHHIAGTRYNIAVDPADGLLACGAPGVQLTWMDAIADGRVITPRRGKPVEINALWLNALVTMTRLSERLGRPSQRWRQQADQVRNAFQRFWNPQLGCCFDVVDAFAHTPNDPRSNDASVRPNQILAVSLPQSGLSQSQQRSLLSVCARELLTSHGLRSLSPADPAYAGRYGGGPSQRDSRYHQGTVWGWLLGPFAEAHWRCHHDRDRALGFLEPMGDHLLDAGLGSISEVFDGDAPHAPDGCIAQAWSVAEVLRCWQLIAGPDHDSA